MLINTGIIEFKKMDNEYGRLTPVEALKDIPFEIKRVYYITNVPYNVTRGFHSHRNLEQVLVCLNGSVKIRVKTPFEEDIVELRDPAKGLYIGNMIWREMFEFSEHSVLLVLASEYYNEDDYLRTYDEYHKEAVEYFKVSQK